MIDLCATAPPVLTLSGITKHEPHARSFRDRRRFVTRSTASYFDASGLEYRKSFEAIGEAPLVPKSGTHNFLRSVQFQFEGGALKHENYRDHLAMLESLDNSEAFGVRS